MSVGDLLPLMRGCHIAGCEARAVVWWHDLGFCADCAGTIDAVRLDQGFVPLEWETEPTDG